MMSSSFQKPNCTQHVQRVKKEMGHALKTTKQICPFLAYGHTLFSWFQACVHWADQTFFPLKLSCSTVVFFLTPMLKLVSCLERPAAFLCVPLWVLGMARKEYSVCLFQRRRDMQIFHFFRSIWGKFNKSCLFSVFQRYCL